MSFSELISITNDYLIKLITLFKQFLRVTEVILIILKNWKYLTAECSTVFTSKPVTVCVCCWGGAGRIKWVHRASSLETAA